jgi:hypothetical protein
MNKIKQALIYILQKREILHLLRRTVPGHHVQHHDASQDSLLHREHHYTMHGHLLSHCAHLLPAVRQRREGEFTPWCSGTTATHSKQGRPEEENPVSCEMSGVVSALVS